MEVQSCSRKSRLRPRSKTVVRSVSQINDELFAEEPFVNVSRAAELQLYLEFAASALKRAAISIIAMALAAPHYRDGADGPAPASPLPC